VNRTDSKAYHKWTLTAVPSCLSATTNYLHVQHHVHSTSPYLQTVIRPARQNQLFPQCYGQHANTSYSHCATASTPTPAIPTQSADSGRVGTEVCRSLILKLHIGLPLWRKYNMENSNFRQIIYFIITVNRYMFRPINIVISSAVQNVLVEHSLLLQIVSGMSVVC